MRRRWRRPRGARLLHAIALRAGWPWSEVSLAALVIQLPPPPPAAACRCLALAVGQGCCCSMAVPFSRCAGASGIVGSGISRQVRSRGAAASTRWLEAGAAQAAGNRARCAKLSAQRIGGRPDRQLLLTCPSAAAADGRCKGGGAAAAGGPEGGAAARVPGWVRAGHGGLVQKACARHTGTACRCAHVPPAQWVYAEAVEGCKDGVRALLHWCT